jgi:hypothetical protein
VSNLNRANPIPCPLFPGGYQPCSGRRHTSSTWCAGAVLSLPEQGDDRALCLASLVTPPCLGTFPMSSPPPRSANRCRRSARARPGRHPRCTPGQPVLGTRLSLFLHTPAHSSSINHCNRGRPCLFPLNRPRPSRARDLHVVVPVTAITSPFFSLLFPLSASMLSSSACTSNPGPALVQERRGGHRRRERLQHRRPCVAVRVVVGHLPACAPLIHVFP